MNNNYSFKRSFYYDVKKAIQKKSIVFILGPRKCGKTVCLKQLSSDLANAVYVDIKAEFTTDQQTVSFCDKVIKDIQNNKNITYLIDEATYISFPDKEIARIANAFSAIFNSNTHIIFSGSQSIALEFWGHIACGNNAAFIQTGFLSYPEWLAYRKTTEISEATFLDYILNIHEFYCNFDNIKEYLRCCLDETVISNSKAAEYIIDNNTGDLDVEMLLDVLYASLINLHNNTTYETFANATQFAKALSYYFRDSVAEINKDILQNNITEILRGRYNSFKAMSAYDCKTAIRFLYNCGLLTLTYISDDFIVDPYITSKILKETNELYLKPQIFSNFNLTINYPMFYLDLVAYVLKDKMTKDLPRELLGSIVECQVRSLLPTKSCFEYRNSNGVEIDYVSLADVAIEISVSNKRMRDINLDLLPDTCRKILLTKDIEEIRNGIEYIPYYKFIFEHSNGQELLHLTGEDSTDIFS